MVVDFGKNDNHSCHFSQFGCQFGGHRQPNRQPNPTANRLLKSSIRIQRARKRAEFVKCRAVCIYSVESSSATFSYVFHRSTSSSLTRSSRVHHVVTSLTRASSSSSSPPVVHTRVYTAVRSLTRKEPTKTEPCAARTVPPQPSLARNSPR